MDTNCRLGLEDSRGWGYNSRPGWYILNYYSARPDSRSISYGNGANYNGIWKENNVISNLGYPSVFSLPLTTYRYALIDRYVPAKRSARIHRDAVRMRKSDWVLERGELNVEQEGYEALRGFQSSRKSPINKPIDRTYFVFPYIHEISLNCCR